MNTSTIDRSGRLAFLLALLLLLIGIVLTAPAGIALALSLIHISEPTRPY